jgi:hypothetical protein
LGGSRPTGVASGRTEVRAKADIQLRARSKLHQKVLLKHVPIFALISELTATGQVHYVRRDNWEVGRTAAWRSNAPVGPR